MHTAIENEILHFDKRFGVITTTKVILTNGSLKQQKIAFGTIDKVNLIKYRVLYTNIFLLLVSAGILAGSAMNWSSEKILIPLLLFVGVCLLVYSLTHKFYYYRLIIKEKGATSHTIKASQLDRKYIKKFYFSILKNKDKKTKFIPENQLHRPNS